MKDDLALTATGTPAVVMGDERYPLVITIAGMKEWAEHKEQSFDHILANGWLAKDLSEKDMAVLLKIALVGGERRRALFGGDEPRPITDELVSCIMSLAHPTEVIVLLVKIWNEPPVREPDPQTPASPPPGE